uniref:Prefoldin subunit 6 n=1 Tax=Rattus norvegicus TaxID=10116 RepID=A0A8I6GI92_RAT
MAELIQKKGEVEKYQQLQKDLSKSMSGRQKLESQLTENNIVKEELALLDGSNVVFKLLGPVLVKQELGEARATVGNRLDYITVEIKRYESQLRDLERQSEQQRGNPCSVAAGVPASPERKGSWESLTPWEGEGAGEGGMRLTLSQ